MACNFVAKVHQAVEHFQTRLLLLRDNVRHSETVDNEPVMAYLVVWKIVEARFVSVVPPAICVFGVYPQGVVGDGSSGIGITSKCWSASGRSTSGAHLVVDHIG